MVYSFCFAFTAMDRQEEPLKTASTEAKAHPVNSTEATDVNV